MFRLQEQQSKLSGDERISPAAPVTNITPSLWKCYWVKIQSMMLLSGFFMLVGSLLHLACPVLLIYIIKFVEDRPAKAAIVSNGTQPQVCIAFDVIIWFLSFLCQVEKHVKPAADCSDCCVDSVVYGCRTVWIESQMHKSISWLIIVCCAKDYFRYFAI